MEHCKCEKCNSENLVDDGESLHCLDCGYVQYIG